MPRTTGSEAVPDTGILRRLTAFAESPAGGNPAGVWVGNVLPDDSTMQRIAADVGYSETAFVAPSTGLERTVRYFSPEAEVPFCGHATIAAGAVLGSPGGEITYELSTRAGRVPVMVRGGGEQTEVSLTSVPPGYRPAENVLLEEVLPILGWQGAKLDPSIPPAIAYAGAWHLVIAVAEQRRLADLDYAFDELKAVMLREGLTTLQLVWRENATLFDARNPFPVGGVVEDPATGAAAAALGGYLREAGIMQPPACFEIRQGEAMGRPSRLRVTVPVSGGIVVTGTAFEIEA
jgi:PhzF family phenazine biosynthesis protein